MVPLPSLLLASPFTPSTSPLLPLVCVQPSSPTCQSDHSHVTLSGFSTLFKDKAQILLSQSYQIWSLVTFLTSSSITLPLPCTSPTGFLATPQTLTRAVTLALALLTAGVLFSVSMQLSLLKYHRLRPLFDTQ